MLLCSVLADLQEFASTVRAGFSGHEQPGGGGPAGGEQTGCSCWASTAFRGGQIGVPEVSG